ncbi:transglycosylase SLT domain-containing protein [Marinicella gelatinilytica]|uniref:transglycosylase SLT domain-containing protein n=1 Tax=Marinicella gelatinilytica TaxID=2996017 RepID=UPI002260AFBC|nr:transglycosylase SLT domain-containing protein [Marinicella gelatinilytica]MCX7544515.1 transglycosylase SLT domain-containing protein [Marinicella gelatinilytica]
MRLILFFVTLFVFNGCQQHNIKKEVQPSVSETSLPALISAIEQCQKNPTCEEALNAYFKQFEETTQTEEMIADQANLEPTSQQPLDVTTLNQPMLANQRIQAALNEWLTWKRPILLETWNNYQFLKRYILPPFTEKNIPEHFMLALIAQESGGRVHSMSSAGASGLFQFMPATAQRFGVVGTLGDYDARYHPKTAAQGAADYIQEQRELYGDDYAKILAAYNAGENRFRRLNNKHNNQAIWQSDFYYDLPRETRGYIASVLSAMLIFSNPDDFNVELTPLDGRTAVIKAHNDVSLSELAVCFGQYNHQMGWYRTLRNLNPTVKAKRVISQGSPIVVPELLKPIYEEQCQDTALMALAKKIHDADFPERPAFTYYRIKKGDSLSTISRQFSCSSKTEIARLNNIKPPRYLINAGKRLKVPQC